VSEHVILNAEASGSSTSISTSPRRVPQLLASLSTPPCAPFNQFNSANASQMANLLTLPREIRDQIYTYLTRDLTVQWHRGIDDWKSTLETTVDIEIKDAPLFHVLLTPSQLRDEYLESTVFKRFSIMLRFAPRRMFISLRQSTSLALELQ
jgi:hypothetical protein